MSSGFRPNDQMRLPGIGVPIDPWTGFQLDQLQLSRCAVLKEAEQALRQVLHDLDGSTLGSPPGDRRMRLAFTKLEEAMMWAQAAILNHGDG